VSAVLENLFLRACAREPVPRPPVWLMRQAGRYLPEYRAIRERHEFLELCRDPELASLVSAQPVDRFGVDAAIIFSDILVPAVAMGVEVDFRPGPVIAEPIASRVAVERLRVEGAAERLAFVPAAIRMLIERLGGRTPVIGFAGAPFTVAAYLVEGAGSTTFPRTKRFLFEEPAAAHALLDAIARVTVEYLAAQRAAGAAALMLFDTHASLLAPEDYETFAARYAERVLREVGSAAPRIYFAPGASAWLGRIARCGAEVIGVDHRIRFSDARRMAGDGVTLQGNLDPAILLGPRETVIERTRALLRDAGERPGHILNLGHGVHKETPVENVRAFVDCAREAHAGAPTPAAGRPR
jgi:uroporphyrinogen decarboxylase